eukprot:TRINITY_DN13649_c0_g1_i1.p1 TRINITY_DN13649_c0_g1~~TRINITY_DN13649_c0_g1_i1.p1  ORF type:complete len:161 (-),score=34.35 TRINITY_DN13649_c0_g1_i1:26-508(-)
MPRDTRSRYVDYGGKAKWGTWDQTEQEVILTVPVGEGVKGREVSVEFKVGHLKVGLKGKSLIIDGDLYQHIVPDDCTWLMDGPNVEITLSKSASSETWWKNVVQGDPEIDVKKIEGAKYLDDSILKKIKEKDDAEKAEKERLELTEEKMEEEGASNETSH